LLNHLKKIVGLDGSDSRLTRRVLDAAPLSSLQILETEGKTKISAERVPRTGPLICEKNALGKL